MYERRQFVITGFKGEKMTNKQENKGCGKMFKKKNNNSNWIFGECGIIGLCPECQAKNHSSEDTLKKIFEGCGETERNTLCNGYFLCDECQSKVKGYIQRTKEIKDQLEKISVKLFNKGDRRYYDIQEIVEECKEIIKLGEEQGIK